ncbi:hypothetical protein BDW02DRAFT_584936 [Decorospora gaudefroyi]|uniref:DUF7582 domain-containing protein n=1 Tax=Decorospora gaudefroyi TaxID=184978 RepID=A0A6A5KY18_9PLEO|nr:hypothetical protein BDW02DRAFT_584936 [Decorospora gaudefroyi]
MGCNISRPQGAHPADTLLEIAPVMTAGHNNLPPDLDRDTLLRALTNVAHYLNSQRANITVISVGGANEWFNNRTVLFIPKANREYLTQRAFAQNETVFDRPGLKVLAAPWDYAMCAKLDRCAGAGPTSAKPYDYSDAATYLHRYLEIYNLTSVTRSQVYAWAASYMTTVTDAVLERLNSEFYSKYDRSDIDMRT